MTESPRSAAKQTVAVVDDDYRILESLYDLLDSAGFDVRLFASPGSLLRTSAIYEVDCVISDIAMPEIDGFALRQLVREARPTLPVILITGRHELVSTNEVDCGAQIVLEKPFHRDKLLAAIDSQLRVSAVANEKGGSVDL
jgi:FixJ family two-component response regulator